MRRLIGWLVVPLLMLLAQHGAMAHEIGHLGEPASTQQDKHASHDLDHDQRLTASAGVSYRWPDSLALSADALYGSGSRSGFANSDHLPSYTQVNVAATRTFDFGQGFGTLDARVAVLNLFDRVYELRDGSGIGVGAPQYGMRRALYAGFSKAF